MRAARPVTLEEAAEELGPGIAAPRLARAHVDDGGSGGLGQLHPDGERRGQGTIGGGFRPEAPQGPGKARRVEVHADRDDPPDHEQDGDQQEGDEPGEALSHGPNSTSGGLTSLGT